jgi:hypothetical protein
MQLVSLSPTFNFERACRKLAALNLRLLQSRPNYEGCPVPLAYWSAFRSVLKAISDCPDPLLPSQDVLQATGASLSAPELQKMLRNDVLGLWALDTPTIDVLWKSLQRERPKLAVECGAGLSTLVLAMHAASCSNATGRCRVLSLEQDLSIKEQTQLRLAKHGLSEYAEIWHIPVSSEGMYEVDATELEERLREEKIDWLLIDGPAGPDGCRVRTLPVLSSYCRKGARWFLDDAFRDGELSILREWCRLPDIAVHGIFPIGKGLGTGIVSETLFLDNALRDGA